MTRKSRRMAVLLACGLGLGSAAALSLAAFSNDIVFFVTPSDLATKGIPGRSCAWAAWSRPAASSGARMTASRRRISASPTARAAVSVAYTGILPDLFREGQGVVTLGVMRPDGSFQASEVLAKHDETYMPKDVADALKKNGLWNPAKGPPPPASTWDTLASRTGG